MCSTGKFDHSNFKANCDAAKFGSCGENILYNYEKSDKAPAVSMQQWVESSGHYENLVGAAYSKVGYGFVVCTNREDRVYWTGLYGT
jgi:uncharacterized protein YkwD